MKKILALILALCMVFALVACGQPAAPAETPAETPAEAPAETPAEEINLRLYVRYSDDDGIPRIDYSLEKLKEEYPNVNFEIVPKAADGGVQLKTMAATGDMCDIFELDGNDTIASLAQLGAIKDMTADIKALGHYDKVLVSEHPKMIFKDGCIYTLPFTGSEIGMLFANTEKFEEFGLEIPRTIPELVECAKVFSEGGLVTIPIFAKEQWICNALYNALVSRYDPRGLDALQSGEASIRDEAYVNAAKDLEALAAAGAFGSSPTNMAYENCTELWYNDNSAMFLNGEWEADSTYNNMGDKAIWVPFPAASEETYDASLTAAFGGRGACGGLSVSAWSDHYDLCVELACRMSELWVEYDYIYRGKACFALNTTKDLVQEATPCHFMTELTEYRPTITSTNILSGNGDNMELYTVCGEGTQSLIAGIMTADEFIESVALVTGD